MLRFDLISIFPEYLSPLKLSLLGKAQDKGLLAINIHDLRDQTTDVHHSVDDTPYGGGAGMVMSPVAWGEAIDQISSCLLYTSPSPRDGATSRMPSSA